MILKMMDQVSKPALAGIWPNQKGMNVVLDLGANIECNDQNLIDFAELGSALYKSLYPNDKPYVALLNVGSEEIKGTESLKKANKRLISLSNENNFIYNGYIEGNKLMSGEANVIVTDGFTGNVALKTAEGTAKFITDNLKKSLTENIFSKISLIFSYLSLKKFKDKLDPRKYNGAIFLGLNGPVVKSHGGIDAEIYHSIDLCYKIVKGNLINQIKNNLSHLKMTNNITKIDFSKTKRKFGFQFLFQKIVDDLLVIFSEAIATNELNLKILDHLNYYLKKKEKVEIQKQSKNLL